MPVGARGGTRTGELSCHCGSRGRVSPQRRGWPCPPASVLPGTVLNRVLGWHCVRPWVGWAADTSMLALNKWATEESCYSCTVTRPAWPWHFELIPGALRTSSWCRWTVAKEGDGSFYSRYDSLLSFVTSVPLHDVWSDGNGSEGNGTAVLLEWK